MEADIVIRPPDTAELSTESHAIIEHARALTVATANDCQEAAALMRGCKALGKRIDEHCDPATRLADQLHKRLVADKKKLRSVPDMAYDIVDAKVRDFRRAEEEQRRRAEAIVEAERRKAAEEERLKAAAEAEEWGDTEEAERLIAAPVQVQPVILPTAVPKMQGVTYVTRWYHRVVDANAIPREWMIPDDKALAKAATANKGKIVIPGIEFYSEESPVTRAGG